MDEQEGIKTTLLGGLRFTLLMEEGKELDEAEVKKAIESKRLKFVSLEVIERPQPTVTYRIPARGLG